jgi:hypothetical protein
LFLEYYFTVMYKPCKTHVVVNALSRLLNITKPICVFDQTIDVRLFYIELEWLNDVNCFLKTRHLRKEHFMYNKSKDKSRKQNLSN